MTVSTPPPTDRLERSTTALYCYGVTWASTAKPQAEGGVGGASVQPIRAGDLAALTSPIESPRVRARRRDLLSHSQVLATAHESGTVLPLRFGAVFESEGAIAEAFLEPRHDELAALLRQFEGRVELSVKAFYREEAILADIVRSDARIARLREATRAGDQAATYPLKVELGERVAGGLRARTERDAQALLERLSPLSLAVDVEQEQIEHQVLKASFLVQRERVPAFDEAMNELATRNAELMHFKYLGPLPPHSFVNLAPDGGR